MSKVSPNGHCYSKPKIHLPLAKVSTNIKITEQPDQGSRFSMRRVRLRHRLINTRPRGAPAVDDQAVTDSGI